MPRRRAAQAEWERRLDEKFPEQTEVPAPREPKGKPKARKPEKDVEPKLQDLPAPHAADPDPDPDLSEAEPEEGLRERHRVAAEALGHESVREAYEELGFELFYETKGASYVNPHEEVLVEALQAAFGAWPQASAPQRGEGGEGGEGGGLRALDLACGSGEATEALEHCLKIRVEAADPYTFEAFERRMGRKCHRWSFQDVAGGVLEQEPSWDLVVCSFALHLLDRSWLNLTLGALARKSQWLLVATPHKRPHVEPKTGWNLEGELLHERVRVRLYRSHASEPGWGA